LLVLAYSVCCLILSGDLSYPEYESIDLDGASFHRARKPLTNSRGYRGLSE